MKRTKGVDEQEEKTGIRKKGFCGVEGCESRFRSTYIHVEQFFR